MYCFSLRTSISNLPISILYVWSVYDSIIFHKFRFFSCLLQYGWRGTVFVLSAVNLHSVVAGMLQRPLKPVKAPAKVNKQNGDPGGPHKSVGTAQSEAKGTPASLTLQEQRLLKPLLKPSSEKSGVEKADVMLTTVAAEEPASASSITSVSDTPAATCSSAWLGGLFDFSLLRNAHFLCFGVSTMLMNVGMMCFYMHTPNRARHYGVPDALVATLPPAIGVCTLCARVVFGSTSDSKYVSRTLQYGIGILLGAIVEMTFVFTEDYLHILIHCLMFGICNGKDQSRSLRKNWNSPSNYCVMYKYILIMFIYCNVS